MENTGLDVKFDFNKILPLLLLLQESTNIEIFYDRIEDTLVKRVGDEYAPLFGEDKLIDYPTDKQKNLIPISNIIASQKQRKSNEKAIEKQEISNQKANEKQELFRKKVGKKQLIIYPIANDVEFSSREIAEICSLIEQKTIRSLKLTNVPGTINKIYENYLSAIRNAKRDDLYRLGASIEFLETKIALQQNSKNSLQKKQQNEIRRTKVRRAFFLSTALFLLSIFGLYFFRKNKQQPDKNYYTQITSAVQIDSLINMYLISADTTITEYRRIYIKKQIALPEYTNKVNDKIKYYAVYGN